MSTAITPVNPSNDPIQVRIAAHFNECPSGAFAKGDTIITAGENPTGVNYLESGIVEEYDITPEGTKVIVNVFKVGSFFPMSWAMNDTPNRYFFSALTDVTVRIDNPSNTLEFLKSNPDILYDLLSRVFKGTDAILRRLVHATSSVSSKRLMFELLLEAYRFGKDTGEGQKQINIRQNVLAARSGLARETVSRELQQLEKKGLILRYKQGIVINTAKIEQALDYTHGS